MAGKSAFFKAAELSSGVVSVEGFGDVELHEMTLKQRLTLTALADEDEEVTRAKVVIMCCDLFNENDVEKLCSIKSSVLLALFTKSMELSGVGVNSKKKP